METFENDAELAEQVPELDRLSPRATSRRRATFVAGRRAARRALEARWGRRPPSLRVDADSSGRPIAWLDGRPSATRVSISHVGGWAVAAAAEVPLGLDLVELEALPPGMRAEAFAPGELEGFERSLDASDLRLPACLAFGAKEAALKWLGVGMAVPLPSVRLTPHDTLAGPYPWCSPARLEHEGGRAELPLAIWPLVPALFCVLLGVSVERGVSPLR